MRGEHRRTSEADRAIGARVRTYRLTAGLSQTDLAKRLGVTFQQVQKYETVRTAYQPGRCLPSPRRSRSGPTKFWARTAAISAALALTLCPCAIIRSMNC
jgi:DNA-binding XRE family transcriptional regulator